MHEEIKSWEKRVDDMCADFRWPDKTVHEEPEMLEAHVGVACNELELEVGHRLLAGEITAEEAYEALATDPTVSDT